MSDNKILDQAFYELVSGKEPTGELSGELHTELLKKVAHFNSELAQAIIKISNGQLETEFDYKGSLAGAVKGLQANLRHLAWQTNAVANGDLTQKVAFMGEFSASFNKMVENLEENRRTIESKEQELERDLALAEEIQKTMLGEITKTDFVDVRLLYHPLHGVSGDFVFTCKSAEQQFSAFLGDASGHGIAAALITIMTKKALETILPQGEPDEVMRKINSLLADSVPEGMYLTGVLVKIKADGKVLLANAAHPVILVQRADSGLIEEFSGTGLSLGMFEEEIEAYSTTELCLNRSDRIFLFSDGLLEMKIDNDFLEIAGIKDILNRCQKASLAETVQTIEAVIKKSSATNLIADDLTVLAIEFIGQQQ